MNWMNFALIAGGLLGSLVVGLIVGRVVAGIKYPNPDKPHIFTPKQSAILLVAVLVAIALVIFAILYQPKPQTAGDDPLVGTDGMMGPDGMMNDPAVGLPQDGLKEGDPAPVDVMPAGGEDLPDGGEDLPDGDPESVDLSDSESQEEGSDGENPPEDGADPDVGQPDEKENPVT